jgi:L-ascorbate peroxidase
MSRYFSSLSSNETLYNRIKNSTFQFFKEKPYMPIFVRLAWHDAGTYDKTTKTGGPNGSIRFEKELAHGANRGLNFAMPFIEEFKKEVTQVSYADLIQAVSVAAIEFSGGPAIPFRFGRVDASSDAECTPEGRLPDASKGVPHLRDVFYRMGFGDLEIVTLSGAHTLGRGWKQNSGFDGPWTTNMEVFDNSYYIELLYKKHQGLLRLPTDDALLTDPGMKEWVERFAADKQVFFEEYKKAHQKLSELGLC